MGTDGYTINEIAIYIKQNDFKHSEEVSILNKIWNEENEYWKEQYDYNRKKFFRSVYKQIYSMNTLNYEEEVKFINKILKENKSIYMLDNNKEEKTIELFLKVIKLNLMYTPKVNYKKIKLRTLLKEFGYKKRSAKFVNSVNRTLNNLGLEIYLKKYNKCNIDDIKIDDVIIIRLK